MIKIKPFKKSNHSKNRGWRNQRRKKNKKRI